MLCLLNYNTWHWNCIIFRPYLLLELARFCVELEFPDLAQDCVDHMKTCVVKVSIWWPSERIEKKRCMTLMWKDLCKNKSFVTQLCVYIWLFRLCFISKIILLIQYLYLIYLLHYLAFEALCLPVYHWLIWLIVWLIDFRIPVSTWNWSSYSVSWWSEA